MSGESSLNRDFSSFKVSNFADQNNVRVLPQKRAQGRRKIQSDLFLHLHLVDSGQLKFNRVFRSHDVGIGFVQRRNGGVQRIGFA